MAASRAKLTGILADPAAADALKAALVAALGAEGARIANVVRGRTPVKTGKLRAGVAHEVKATKKGVVLVVSADAATRDPTPGDSVRDPFKDALFAAREAAREAAAKRKGKAFVPKKQTANKGGRRYGPVPYGVFVDHETGFLRGTFKQEQPAALQAAADAVNGYVTQQNKRFG